MNNNKGYTIMEAVIAMFLVVVMVGAVFSALMSSRRAISASSEKEEVLYGLQSAYGMLKECRSNPNCRLIQDICPNELGLGYVTGEGGQELRTCDDLFTFNFQNLCKDVVASSGTFTYRVVASTGPLVSMPWGGDPTTEMPTSLALPDFDTLEIQASCTEQL